MKFRCERDSLVEALTTAGRAVSSRTSTAVALGGLRLEVAGNHLSIVGTDVDLTVHVATEAIGIADGVCVAPAKLLADIVRSLEPGAVTIESDSDKVEIGAARSHFGLRTYPVEDFPSLPEPPAPATFIPASALAEALRQVVRAASNDDARPLLTGVLIAAEGSGVRLVATDSYRLALRDMTGATRWPKARQILVPARALMELQRLSGLSGSGKEAGTTSDGVPGREAGLGPTVGLSIGDHEVTFTSGRSGCPPGCSKGRYPDYRQLIPSEYPNRLHVGKDSLLDALRRVRLLVQGQHDAGPPVDAPRRRRYDRGLPGGG